MAHHVVVGLTATMIVGEEATVATAEAGTTTTIADLPAMTTAARMADEMITALEALIAMLPEAVMIAIAAVATITVVAEVMAEMMDALPPTTPLRGVVVSRTEVETMWNTVLTIGTPINKLRSANPLRCGALCQITRSNLLAAVLCITSTASKIRLR